MSDNLDEPFDDPLPPAISVITPPAITFRRGLVESIKYGVKCDRCSQGIIVELLNKNFGAPACAILVQKFREQGWEMIPQAEGYTAVCPLHGSGSIQVANLRTGEFFAANGDIFMQTGIQHLNSNNDVNLAPMSGWRRALNLSTGKTTDFKMDFWVKKVKREDIFLPSVLGKKA